MTFGSPHLLWLTLVPLALFVWEMTHRRGTQTSSHSKILRAEAGAHSIKLIPTSGEPLLQRSRIRPWLFFGLLFAVVAAARPQWGRLEEPVFDQAREILIAIDLSRSMLTPDVKPSRLDRAKLLTQSLLERLAGERVGLVVFSGTAFLQSPLSSDYEILREFLPALNPEFLPEGGTNYTALIDASIGAFGSSGAADRFLVILSDGEATEDDWRDRAEQLKKKGIRVIGLGVGTSAGAMIPDGAGGLVKDERGAVVLSKLESGTLRQLAEMTNGVYQDASTWIDLAALVNSTVESGKKGDFTEKNTIRLVERYQWPLAFAVWCLLVSLYYEFPVRPKPRNLQLTPAPTGANPAAASIPSTVALLLLCAVCLASSRTLRAAEDTGPALGKIYSRLATQDKLSAQDYAEVARETLRWGQRLKENGQPVTAGPVHDAIEAVDSLIAIDSKIADWTKLRGELEALLEKPPEQKQDKKDDQQQKDQEQKNQDQKQSQDQQKQDQSKQDQSKQDQQKQQQQSEPKDDKSQKQNDKGQKGEKPEDKESAFGDMKKQEQPPPPPGENQKVGGTPEKKLGEQPPEDPSLALPLQKLDQLKNKDSPAELFKMMEGEKDNSPRKTTKDW
jgi:Ca-activated chloride channel homolog